MLDGIGKESLYSYQSQVMVPVVKNLIFILGFALLSTHELDAVSQAEWRLLFILSNLPESIASAIFVAAHVPLFTIILWLAFNVRDNLKEWSRIIFSTFLIVHARLHKALENHPLYTFNSPLSQALIFAGGLTGLIYLMLIWIESQDKAYSK